MEEYVRHVSLDAEKKRYTTCATRSTFPAGTECWAHRDPVTDDLHLTFDDGTVEILSGPYFAKGLESRRIPRIYISAEADIINTLSEKMKQEIDAEVLKELFDVGSK